MIGSHFFILIKNVNFKIKKWIWIGKLKLTLKSDTVVDNNSKDGNQLKERAANN